MYKIYLLPQAQKDLKGFRGKIHTQLIDKILTLADNPCPSGCLKLTVEEGYRLRSGNYRILYRISDPEKKVMIYRVKHRKEVYEV